MVQASTNNMADKLWMYELYAILVHRGSAMGGHYYAFIKVSSSI